MNKFSTHLHIRPESSHDWEAIYHIHHSAFGQKDEAELVNTLRQSEYYIPELSLVAEKEHDIVGHILFTKIHIRNEENDSTSETLALAPVSVLPAYQAKGIGTQLIMKGLEVAPTLGYTSVILLGHPAYYPKFGFEPTSTWNISPPFDVPEEAFMGIELVPNGLSNIKGTVQYPEIWGL